MFREKSKANSQARKGWLSSCLSTALAVAAFCAAPPSHANAAAPNTMPIWRIQVRFITANVDDAGTDDSVKVGLNGSNSTFLDSGRDDRERSSDETFDLRAEGINTLSDLDFLRVEKTGSDGWAIRRMFLIVNEVVIYDEEFPSTLWLDNEDGHARVFFLDDQFMRQRSEWASYVVPTRPSVIPAQDMERRIEALAGDWATSYGGDYGYDLIGGNDAVELFTYGGNTWRVDLDMEEVKPGPVPNPDIDVDFDLTVSCVGGRPDFVVSNANISDPWPAWGGPVRTFVNAKLRAPLNEMMKNFRFTRFCPSMTLAPNGDLHFTSTFPPVGTYPGSVLIDSVAPIALHIATWGEGRPDSKNAFVATVRSNLERDTKVEVSFELPPQISALEQVVEVRAGKESYQLEVKVDARKDGTSRIAFADSLPANLLVEYTLPLLYHGSKESVVGEVRSVVQPLEEEVAATVTALEAVTSFDFAEELVVPSGTLIMSSQYVTDLPKEPLPAPQRLPNAETWPARFVE